MQTTAEQIEKLNQEIEDIEGDISEAQRKLNATIEGKSAKINERLNSKDEKIRERQIKIFELEREQALTNQRDFILHEIEKTKGRKTNYICPLCVAPARLDGHLRDTGAP